MRATEGAGRMRSDQQSVARRDFGRYYVHGPKSAYNDQSPYSTCTFHNHEAVISMARGRSNHHADQRGTDDLSRRRSRERSRSPHRPGHPAFRHPASSREHQAQSSRKELFPNRRPSSRERDNHHHIGQDVARGRFRDSLDGKGEERSHRSRQDNGLTTSRREQESNAVTATDGHHVRKLRSRSPSSHKNRKRPRERSLSHPPNPNGSGSRRPFAENSSKPHPSFSGSNTLSIEERRPRDLSPAGFGRKQIQRSDDKEQPNVRNLFERENQLNKSPFDQPSRDHQHNAKENRQAGDWQDESDRQPDTSRKHSKKRRRGSRRSRSPRGSNPISGQVHRERPDLPQRSRSPTGRESHSQLNESRRRSRDRSTGQGQHPSSLQRRSQSPLSAPIREPTDSSHQFHNSRGKSPRFDVGREMDSRPPQTESWGRGKSPRRKPGAAPSTSIESIHHERHPARRSRSRSVQSMSGASDKDRSRRESPDVHNSNYRDRPYHSGPRKRPNSPEFSQYPHKSYQDDWPDRGWGNYGRGSPPPHGYSRHGHQSPHHHGNYGQHPNSYYQDNSYGPSRAHSEYGPPHRGRGGGHPQSNRQSSPSQASARSHFQNLSWTPQKGSRGGVAPSERLPQPLGREDMADNGSDVDDSTREDDRQKSMEYRGDTAPPKDPEENIANALTEKEEELAEPVSRDGVGMPPPSKTSSIKFAMKSKIQPQPSLLKRLNPIQSASKPAVARPMPPREPRGFAAEEDLRRADYPPNRLPSSPRFGPGRHEEWERPRRPADRERLGPFDRPHPPPFSPAKDRRPQDVRDKKPPPRSRTDALGPRQQQRQPLPRRKKIIKILKKHRRVLLPAKLPESWAHSNFMYYPKPDGQSVVGAGTYGKVFKAHNVYLNKVVALKTLPLFKHRRKPGTREYITRDRKRKRQERWVKEGLHLTSLREIKLLKSISHQHENVVGIREIFLENQCCNLVFDYFEFDMHGIIYSRNVNLNESMMKDLVRQVFQGLDFLHSKASILHRDIKAANILVGTGGQVKITDFGLAKHVKDPVELESERWYRKKFEHSNRVITTPYRPPELFLGATLYGGEVDVWSAGCVLFEAFLKRLPFQGTGEDIDHLLTIWKILGVPNANLYPEVVDLEWYWLFGSRVIPKKSIFARLYQDKVSPQLYHLLRCIFQHDPKKRPTAAQVLGHPFFTTEAPLPISAAPVLAKVEGEWHELEYKMIRDKEKAEARRKHEDNVILGFLQHKKEDHERKLGEAILDSEIDSEKERINFYENERKEYQLRIEARPKENKTDSDHASLVVEMKKTHGEMYMDVTKRSRYRGPARDKIDERLFAEAWKWYEDEKKKGNNPVPSVPLAIKVRKAFRAQPETTKPLSKSSSLKQAPSSAQDSMKQGEGSRNEKRHEYERKRVDYERHLMAYQQRKEKKHLNGSAAEKRTAASPLVEAPEAKKVREGDDSS